jgi:DNA invertase Pin-like site-specific DNA recombinase
MITVPLPQLLGAAARGRDGRARHAGGLRRVAVELVAANNADTLDAAGVRLASLRKHIDRATPEGRLQTGILAEFAEFEREKGRARTRAGISSRATSGKPWGSPAFPYRKLADGHWEPNPAEVPVARRIVQERVKEGRS